jgi:hypothetical protein
LRWDAFFGRPFRARGSKPTCERGLLQVRDTLDTAPKAPFTRTHDVKKVFHGLVL